MGQVRNVVLMNVYLDLENPGGSGFRVGGYMSQVREMGKSVYEQPGNEVDGSYHSQEGYFLGPPSTVIANNTYDTSLESWFFLELNIYAGMCTIIDF